MSKPKKKVDSIKKNADIDLHKWYKIKEIASEVFYNYSFEIHWFKKCWLFLEGQLLGTVDGKFLEDLDEENKSIPSKVFIWILTLYAIYFKFKISIELETHSSYPNIKELFSANDIYGQELTDNEYEESLLRDIEECKMRFKKIFSKVYADEFKRLDFFVNGDSVITQEDFQKCFTTINEDDIKNLSDYYFLRDTKYEEYKSTISIQNLEQYKIMQGLLYVNEL